MLMNLSKAVTYPALLKLLDSQILCLTRLILNSVMRNGSLTLQKSVTCKDYFEECISVPIPVIRSSKQVELSVFQVSIQI